MCFFAITSNVMLKFDKFYSNLQDFVHTPDSRGPMTSYLSTPSKNINEWKKD